MEQIFENGINCKYSSIPVLYVSKEEWEAHKDEYSKVLAFYFLPDSESGWFMGKEFTLDQIVALDHAIALALSRR